MLHHAHNLCDEGEPLKNEVKLLNNAFIANGYHPKDVDQIISKYEHQMEIKMRKWKIDVIPYVFHMFKDRQTC